MAYLPGVYAAEKPIGKEIAKEEAGGDYWTAERIKNARALSIPLVAGFIGPLPEADQPTSGGKAISGTGKEGKEPTVDPRSIQPILLFEPDPVPKNKGDKRDPQPMNVGTSGAQFTSTRVFPDAATITYPYLTVGKLFFRIPGEGDFVCSAATQRPRVVTTAGHCVHSGTSAGFFTNWLFVPAYLNGVAPVGTFTPTYVVTTMGYLGYFTSKLSPNHANLLGYPQAFDGGEMMHEVTAESFASGGNNTILYGSDMTGGSSGGPWVQNFGVPAIGQTVGQNTLANAIIGVTSYGRTDPSVLVAGSSIPDSRFISVLNAVCNHKGGNC